LGSGASGFVKGCHLTAKVVFLSDLQFCSRAGSRSQRLVAHTFERWSRVRLFCLLAGCISLHPDE
jgi:hypothetical protein